MRFILRGVDNNYGSWKMIQEAVSLADEVGFWGVSLPDHYMYRYGDRVGSVSTLDSWVTLSYLAAKTQRVKLGTLVTPIPFRPPSILAKMVATLDVLSSGRTFLGVGAGWSQMEFEGFSEWADDKTRVDKAEEGVQLILKLWSEPKVDFHGKFYTAKGAVLEPKPSQDPNPPLLFGGYSVRMLRMAGRYADICYVPPWVKVPFDTAKTIVSQEARQAGRRPPSFAAGSPSFEGRRYDVTLARKDLETAANRGCEYYITPWFPSEEYIGTVNQFAGELMSSYAEK